MPKITTLESFGVSFGILTEKFLTSGLERFEIDCETAGQAINIRMRLNQYWKVLRTVPIEQVPPGLRNFLPEMANLSVLHTKGDRKVILTTKDERKMDQKLLQQIGRIDEILKKNPLDVIDKMKSPEAAKNTSAQSAEEALASRMELPET